MTSPPPTSSAAPGDHHHAGLGRLTVVTSRTTEPAEVLGTIRAMASDITLYGRSVVPVGSDPVVDQALAVFTSVHEACTRFDPDSPLMRANARPDEWHVVPLVLLAAVREAHRAYQRTDGRFDPRILGDLVRLGYDRSLPVRRRRRHHGIRRPPATCRCPVGHPASATAAAPNSTSAGLPIDLGGIGKSLAVRWASEELQEHFEDFLLDAGGDCYCEGTGPRGGRLAGGCRGSLRRRPAPGRSGPERQGLRHLLGQAAPLAGRARPTPTT